MEDTSNLSYKANAPLCNRQSTDTGLSCLSVRLASCMSSTSDDIQFKLGEHVVVTEGEFKSDYGIVICLAWQQRVIVELFNDFSVCAEGRRLVFIKYENGE